MSEELALRKRRNWVITIGTSGLTPCLTLDNQEITGSFQDLEDYMFENSLLSREEFKQRVWYDGFLCSRVGDILVIEGSDK